jgi:hypothetical protein
MSPRKLDAHLTFALMKRVSKVLKDGAMQKVQPAGRKLSGLGRWFVLLGVLFSVLPSAAQNSPFALSVQPMDITNLPRLHSFAAAQFQGKWYLFGGRRDGLHRRQPFRAFDSAHANRYIWRVDPQTHTVDSLSINLLSPSLQSQLSSTNMLFHQEDNQLFLAGGYGLPNRKDISLFTAPSRFTDPEAHRTFPYLTKVDLAVLELAFLEQQKAAQNLSAGGSVSGVLQGGAPHSPSPAKKKLKTSKSRNLVLSSAFQQWTDSQFALTGGAMLSAEAPETSIYYLVGGHRFDGLYNPMGPQNGPGFEQEYHHGVRCFTLETETIKPKLRKSKKSAKRKQQPNPNLKSRVVWGATLTDSQFRRRDVNVMESLHHQTHKHAGPFPDIRKDLMVFSGVFQERANIPNTNLLEIRTDSQTLRPVPQFNQLLNHYHSAHTSLYSYKADAQFYLFFGGIAQYFLNDTGDLVQDPDVPVVSTLSMIARNSANEYSEFALPIKLPKGIGAGTEFIPAPTLPRMENSEVIDLESLTGDSQLLGYLVGGFSTTAPNVFFDNDADESWAESHAYAVFWKRNTEFRDPAQYFNLADAWPIAQGNNGQIHFQAFTNTENGKVYFMIHMTEAGPCTLILQDDANKSYLKHVFPGGLSQGESVFALPIYDANRTKTYRLEFQTGDTVLREILIINP